MGLNYQNPSAARNFGGNDDIEDEIPEDF